LQKIISAVFPVCYGKFKQRRKMESVWIFFATAEFVGQLLMIQTEEGKKIIFIGNGASASISSHMATDYWK
jgi:phosphoheptose isomerase